MPRGKLLNGLVTQQKVLRAAVALFLEKGYTKTTTGEIAKAAGIGQSSFFHVFPSKEALLLELVKRMFSGQFALAGQHSGEQDPVLLYAVETALQLHIAELTEPLRELYVMAYSLPSIAAYLYKSTTKRLQVFSDLICRRRSLRTSTRWRSRQAVSCGASCRFPATCISRWTPRSPAFWTARSSSMTYRRRNARRSRRRSCRWICTPWPRVSSSKPSSRRKRALKP